MTAAEDTLPAERPLRVVIVCLAVTLRFWAIDFHLPLLTHPDEPHYVHAGLVSAVRGLEPRKLTEGNLVPTWIAVWSGFVYATGRLTGRWADPETFLEAHVADPSPVFLGGRVANAAASVGLVIALLALGPAVVGRRAALSAALFCAVNADDVREAHFLVGHDIATFFAMVALLAVLAEERGRPLRAWLACGVCVGLAAAAKAHALFVVPAVLVRLVQVARRGAGAGWTRLVGALVAGVALGHLAGAPGMVRAPLAYLQGLARETGFRVSGGYVDTGDIPRLAFYALYHGPGGFGLPLWIVALAGWVHAVVRPTGTRRLLALSVLPLAVALHFGHGYARYALPAVPVLCLTAGAFVDGFGRALPAGARGAAALIAIPFLIAIPLARSIRYDRLLAAPDTRALARAWIEAHVPPGSPIVNEGMEIEYNVSRVGVPLVKRPASLERQLGEARRSGSRGALVAALAADARHRTSYAVENVVRLDEPSALVPDCAGTSCLEAYRSCGVEYLVSIDWVPRRAVGLAQYGPDVWAALARDWTPVARFAPHPAMPYCTMTWLISWPALDGVGVREAGLVHGPEVVVYRRRDAVGGAR